MQPNKKEREQFDQNERSVKGSIENGLKLFDWTQLFRRGASPDSPGLKDLFQTLTSEARRRQILLDRHEADQKAMRKEQRDAELEAERIAKQHYREKQSKAREDYVLKARRMQERQERNTQQLRETQREVNRQRNDLLRKQREREREHKRKVVLQQKLQREYDEAAETERDQQESGDTEKTGQGTGSIESKSSRKRRRRKPRDKETSRRKRDIEKRQKEAVEKQDQKSDERAHAEDEFEKRMLNYLNRKHNDPEPNLDFDF